MPYKRTRPLTVSRRNTGRNQGGKGSRKSSSRPMLQTRVSSSGYQQFKDPNTGQWTYTHRRVAEKKLRGNIRTGYEVHHIDGNKNNNRSSNLVVVTHEKHRKLHGKKS